MDTISPSRPPQLAAEFIIRNTVLTNQPLKSEEYRKTAGSFINSHIKFERDKKGTVAFLGGSITQNSGWRDSICNYLEQRFPDTRFTFINAGISSMGTTPGAFRIERDVLSKGSVDLLFEEAAVNDAGNGRTAKEQIRGLEGIIRHTLTANPTTDIIVMNFVDPEKMNTYNRGNIPEVISNFDKVTNHYQICTINLAKEVTERINNKEFTWEDDFKNLHPSPFGQGVYFHSMKTFLGNTFNRPLADDDKIKAHPIPAPYDSFCYVAGQIIPFNKATKLKGFEQETNWTPSVQAGTRKGYVNVDMLVDKKPGDSFVFKFHGKAVGIMVAAGPDAGMIEYSIDGKDAEKVDLFTQWSSNLYLPWYKTLASELDNNQHELKVKISQDTNPQSLGNSCIIKAFYIN